MKVQTSMLAAGCTATNFSGSLAGDVSGPQGTTVIGALKVQTSMLAAGCTATNFSGALGGVVGGTQSATTITALADSHLAQIVTSNKVANSATSATSSNALSTIVMRDGTTGGFYTGSVVADTLICDTGTSNSTSTLSVPSLTLGQDSTTDGVLRMYTRVAATKYGTIQMNGTALSIDTCTGGSISIGVNGSTMIFINGAVLSGVTSIATLMQIPKLQGGLSYHNFACIEPTSTFTLTNVNTWTSTGFYVTFTPNYTNSRIRICVNGWINRGTASGYWMIQRYDTVNTLWYTLLPNGNPTYGHYFLDISAQETMSFTCFDLPVTVHTCRYYLFVRCSSTNIVQTFVNGVYNQISVEEIYL